MNFQLFSNKKYLLSECFRRYFARIEADILLSKKSIAKYREVAGRIIFLCGDIDIRKITQLVITELKQKMNEKGLSSSRKNHHMVVLKNLLRFMKDEESVECYNADLIKKFKIPRKQINYLTKEEMLKLIDSITENTIARLRLKTAVVCLISCGCRVSELISLNIADVNFETGKAQVIAKGGKLHTLIFNDMALEYIKKYILRRSDKHEALFVTNKLEAPNRWCSSDLQRALKEQGERAGFSQSIHPHLLRRSAGTLLFHQNASLSVVQRFLGHATPTVTERYYLGNTSFAEVEKAHKSIMNFGTETKSGEGVKLC